MSAKFYFNTSHGHQYRVHENGDIERLDMDFTPSGEWVMLGIIPVRCTNLSRMIPLAEIDPEKINWTYNNGKPRFAVIDRDHGTTRRWGSGIKHFSSYHHTPDQPPKVPKDSGPPTPEQQAAQLRSWGVGKK